MTVSRDSDKKLLTTNRDSILIEAIIRIGELVNNADNLRKNPKMEEHREHWTGVYHGLKTAQKEVSDLRVRLWELQEWERINNKKGN